MKCFLDMDGVLCDFVLAACQLHGADDPYKHDRNLGVWGFDKLIGVDTEAFWKPLGYEFWSTLPWMHDAGYILRLVERTFGKENVCLLTSPCDTAGCVEGKREWVKQNMPDYSRRLLIGSAKEFCAGPNRVLIDDYDHNVKVFRAAGGEAVLVPRKWNQGYRLSLLGTYVTLGDMLSKYNNPSLQKA